MQEKNNIEKILIRLNPHAPKKWWNLIKKTNSSEVHDMVSNLNSYLKENYYDENLTNFNYEILKSLFEWEAKISDQLSESVSKVLPYVEDGDIIYDIGANMGQFSRYLLKKKKVKAVLFEPVPLYRDYIRLVTANMPSVEVVGKALSDSSGVETIYIDHSNLGWNTLIGEKQTVGMHAVDIQTITLDEYMAKAGHANIQLMKIDVEGAEFKVLAGAHDALSLMPQKPYIVLEIGWGQNHPYWAKEVEEFEWLMKNGWSPFKYEFNGTTDVFITPSYQQN